MTGAGHNSGAGQLRAYFERWQVLESEKTDLAERSKELFAEMKALGFDTKAARAVFRDRVKDEAERQEAEAVYDLYWSALDEALSVPPARPARSARENIEQIDPETGEITESEAPRRAHGTSPAARLADESARPLSHSLPPSSSRMAADKPGAGPPPPASGALSEIPAGSHVASSKRPIQGVPATDADAEAEAPGGPTGHESASPKPDAVASASGSPFPAPHSPPANDGQPGKQGFDAGGAKMDGACEASPERVGQDAKSEPAVAPFTEDDVPAFLKPPKPQKPVRAGCLEPECCASYSAGLCHRCTKAAAEVAA